MNESKINQYLKPLIWGVLSSTVVITLLFVLAAAVISSSNIPSFSISIIVTLIAGIGSFIGAFISAKIFGKKGFWIGLFLGLILCFIIFMSTLFIADVQNSISFWVRYIIIIISALLGGMFGVNSKSKKRR